MRRPVSRLACLIPLVLVSCALGETVHTPPAPITLPPPATIVYQGQCERTKALEDWLQVTSGLASGFLTQLSMTIGQGREDIRDDLLALASLRDAVYQTVTPDCATAAQLKLTGGMSKALDILQAFVNGDVPDISAQIADASREIEEAMAMQSQLAGQMEAQFRQQAITPTPSS